MVYIHITQKFLLEVEYEYEDGWIDVYGVRMRDK